MYFKVKMTLQTEIKRTFCLLVLLLSFQIQAQEKISNLKEALKAEAEINRTQNDTSKVNRLLQLSEWFRTSEQENKENTNKAISYVNKVIQLSQKLKFTKGMGSGYLGYSLIEQDRHDYKKTLYYAQKAANYFQSAKEYNLLGEAQVMLWSGATLSQKPVEDRIRFLKAAAASFEKAHKMSRLGDCMKELGDIYRIDHKFGDALTALKLALSCYTSAGRKDLHGVYDLLGIVYSSLGDYKEGIRYGIMAARRAEQLGEKGGTLCTIFNRIGMTYQRYNDYNNALIYYERAFKIATENKDLPSINIIYAEKAGLLMNQKKFSETKAFLDKTLHSYPELYKIDSVIPAYLYFLMSNGLNEKAKAAHYFKVLEKLLEKKDMTPLIKLNIYESFMEYLIRNKEFEKAAYYGKIFSKTMEDLNYNKSASYYQNKFILDSISGNYISAIKNIQKQKKVEEKISNEETKRQIYQLNVLYETEKKNRNISQLTKTTELQKKNLEQARKMRNITFIILALVLIILLLAVNGYYQKQRTNKLLEKKQKVINDANKSLQHLVDEKEWLLREIHHRVKNNLHMVSGLLASQTEFIEGEEALRAITDSQNRVQAMSIIHQKLYQTETLSHINMAGYISELTEYLDSSSNGKCPVKFRLDIDPLDFPLSHSIPIGLIINEAVTNSIKYAFDVCGDCTISIQLNKKTANQYMLKISDNGKGMPEDFNISETNSLGMRLIEGLSYDIHADLKIYNDNGNVIELFFTIDENNDQNQ